MNFKNPIFLIVIAFYSLQLRAEAVLSAPEVPAEIYQLIDLSTETVLAEKNSTTRTQIASLTKVMTAYVAFTELKRGKLHLDDEVLVSRKAWKTDGSRMFIEVGNKVTIDELLKGMLTVSGNDASVAIAEHIGGSESRFVVLMNAYAKDIGMNDTVFANATGLPTRAEQYSNAHDLGILATRIYKDYPEYAHYFKAKEYKYDNIVQPNRNRLLHEDENYTGMKTGYTVNSKYSLMSSYEQNNRHLITVVLNAQTITDRFLTAKTLTNYGFRRFTNVHPIVKGKQITTIPVFYGTKELTGVYAADDLIKTVPVGITSLQNDIHLEANLDSNGENGPRLYAPITEQYRVGEIKAFYKNQEIGRVDLITKEKIDEANLLLKAKDWLRIKLLD